MEPSADVSLGNKQGNLVTQKRDITRPNTLSISQTKKNCKKQQASDSIQTKHFLLISLDQAQIYTVTILLNVQESVSPILVIAFKVSLIAIFLLCCYKTRWYYHRKQKFHGLSLPYWSGAVIKCVFKNPFKPTKTKCLWQLKTGLCFGILYLVKCSYFSSKLRNGKFRII